MNILFDQILQHREAAALPSLSESGGLPALISGLSAVHRANLAAALRSRTGRPLVVICPDDTAAETFARDLSSMLGEEAVTLEAREFTFVESEAVSRGGEMGRALRHLAQRPVWLYAVTDEADWLPLRGRQSCCDPIYSKIELRRNFP